MAFPEPAQVGKAFVKQYYTQMHKDPSQMHRFYLEASSFVHGGSDVGCEEPVIGQQAIHEKILSLDFQKVHAMIKQVDSHATLQEGIVIQVTGELSIGGHPMRAFVQTFVLALESPKKYYVYNDIFRYQDDDLVSESDIDKADNPGLIDPGADEGGFPTAHSAGEPPDQAKDELYRPQSADLGSLPEQTMPPLAAAEESVVVKMVTTEPVEPAPSWNDQFPEATARLNENGLSGDVMDESHTPQAPSSQEYGLEPSGHVIPGAEVGRGVSDAFGRVEPQEFDNSPKGASTWASRLRTGPGFPAGGPSSKSVPSTAFPQREPKPRRDHTSRAAVPLATNPPPSTNPPPPITAPTSTPSSTVSRSDASKKGAPIISGRDVPDACQIFVGGLPSNATEDDIKVVFSSFGKILEVRVNQKNFAFVVFDGPEAVHKVIIKKDQIQLKGKHLNIEPKRPSASRMAAMKGKKPLNSSGGGGGKPRSAMGGKPVKRWDGGGGDVRA